MELIGKHGDEFGLDDKFKIKNFLAQAGYESKKFTSFKENLNYRIQELGVSYWTNYFNPPSHPNADPNKANPFDYEQYPGSKYVDHEKFANYVYDDANRDSKHKLGNTDPGDGYKYRGRGIFQLTGEDNYTDFNNFYQGNYDSSLNLINNPSIVANNMKIAVLSAMWYFKNKVLDDSNFNEGMNVLQITELVNGGDSHIDERENLCEEINNKINCQ